MKQYSITYEDIIDAESEEEAIQIFCQQTPIASEVTVHLIGDDGDEE